jgi:hypothetical protein
VVEQPAIVLASVLRLVFERGHTAESNRKAASGLHERLHV